MTRTVAGTASLAFRWSRSGGMEVRRLSQTTATRPIRAILRIGSAKGEVQRQPGAGDRATVSLIGNHRAAPAPGFPHFRKEGSLKRQNDQNPKGFSGVGGGDRRECDHQASRIQTEVRAIVPAVKRFSALVESGEAMTLPS